MGLRATSSLSGSSQPSPGEQLSSFLTRFLFLGSVTSKYLLFLAVFLFSAPLILEQLGHLLSSKLKPPGRMRVCVPSLFPGTYPQLLSTYGALRRLPFHHLLTPCSSPVTSLSFLSLTSPLPMPFSRPADVPCFFHAFLALKVYPYKLSL